LDFDVEATVLDQQFKFSSEPPPRKIATVVKETKGLVLIDSEKEVTEALYHADCGGMTESPDNVWGGKHELHTQQDSPHRSRHWQVEFERQGLVQKFTQYFGLNRTPNLRSLQAVGRSAGGRVKEIRVDLSDAGVKQISSQEFRSIVGYDKIPSANFRISWLGPRLHISGQGSGHGVGLCQLGARAMAEQGKTFREILNFYYPKSAIAQLDSKRLVVGNIE
jgi:stage II sporulation protein D